MIDTCRWRSRRRSVRSTTPAWLVPLLLAVLGTTAGCEPADPLETIRQQQLSGDVASTVEPLRELLLERKDDPEVNYLYGRALVATGWPSLATWPLRQAMEDPEWLIPAGMELARAGLITGDFNETVEVTTRILEEHPEDARALLFRAQAQAHWKQDPEAALADAERVFELAPDMIEAYEPLILALLSLDRHEEAAEKLAEAGRRMEAENAAEDRLAWHCATTATFAAEAGETERAREVLDGCLEKYPADVTVVSSALPFFESQGELERSIEVLRVALEKAPDQRVYRTGLAERLRLSGRPEEGEALLREATEVDDPRLAVAAWGDLANYRHAMQEHGAAADALERALERAQELGESPPRLVFQYADALLISGQLDRALEVAEEIPVSAQRQLIRGRVAQERGDPAQALAEFDEALRVWPDNPSARYYAARAAAQLGDFDRALEEYRYSIRIDMGATDARTQAAKLLIAENQHKRAYQLLFLEAANTPLRPEGELLGIYLIARSAGPQYLQKAVWELAARKPGLIPEALARAAEGVSERAGAASAVRFLTSAPGVDFTRPGFAPTLRALVRAAHEAGQPEVARKALDAALAAHPEVADFHQIRGLQLELAEAPTEEVRAAYARAVELDPEHSAALYGLGRLARDAGDPARALALFDRAINADPSDADVQLDAARIAIALGQLPAAALRLDKLLEREPVNGEVAAERADLDLRRGSVSPQTLERAQRAVRFGGGLKALERLARVYAELDQPEEAERVTQRAEALRERLAAGRSAEPGDGDAAAPAADAPDADSAAAPEAEAVEGVEGG